ncbi:HNH endonuclease signature motif containing protein [Acetobacter senegalensis]|uniref:HNH endonuclease signature motif containing protein n=1 Tax=Acetobacter senegalensis TaxID=446692 RepID=UPI002653B584|nr:HNH endonuclease signature motif containing protein [Acetobacter senegalensis]MDN7354608.1 HNH endonuclease signature motif containing protein [Acetobacter senegalensis]
MSRKPTPAINRVKAKCVTELPPEGSQISSPCQTFKGATLPKGGHGVIWDNGKMVLAHHVAFRAKYGPIQEGMVVMHLCDNPACCNPDHMALGTQKENTHDSVLKGRHNRANPQHFLDRVLAQKEAGKSPEETAEATGIEISIVKWLLDFSEYDADIYEPTKARYGDEVADEQRQGRLTYDWLTFTHAMSLPFFHSLPVAA